MLPVNNYLTTLIVSMSDTQNFPLTAACEGAPAWLIEQNTLKEVESVRKINRKLRGLLKEREEDIKCLCLCPKDKSAAKHMADTVPTEDVLQIYEDITPLIQDKNVLLSIWQGGDIQTLLVFFV